MIDWTSSSTALSGLFFGGIFGSNPLSLISVEKPAWNSKHVLHSSGGFDLSSVHTKMDYLFEEAQRRGILTLGIGDGGKKRAAAEVITCRGAVCSKIQNIHVIVGIVPHIINQGLGSGISSGSGLGV